MPKMGKQRQVVLLGECGYEWEHVKTALLAPLAMTAKKANPQRLLHEFKSLGNDGKDVKAFVTWLIDVKSFERLDFQGMYLHVESSIKDWAIEL